MPSQPTEKLYSIPARFRKLENLHIVLWLIKDLCWAMLWKPLGLIMIVPTIGAALLLHGKPATLKANCCTTLRWFSGYLLMATG